MALKQARPLSPHLTIWKWGVHMGVSILNRAMGVGLATIGTLALVWWLMALASGPEAYASFMTCAHGLYGLGYVVAIGLTFAFFLHLCAGLRHFVMDAGAGFELNNNKLWAWLTIIAAALMTAGTWIIVLGKAL